MNIKITMHMNTIKTQHTLLNQVITIGQGSAIFNVKRANLNQKHGYNICLGPQIYLSQHWLYVKWLKATMQFFVDKHVETLCLF